MVEQNFGDLVERLTSTGTEALHECKKKEGEVKVFQDWSVLAARNLMESQDLEGKVAIAQEVMSGFQKGEVFPMPPEDPEAENVVEDEIRVWSMQE